MPRTDTADRWGRVIRDPVTLLLAAAAAIQLAFGITVRNVVRPEWAIAGIAAYAVTVGVAALARRRHDPRLRTFAAFLLLVVAACWRAADKSAGNGLGGIVLVTVIWLGLYATLRQVVLGIVLGAVAFVVPGLLPGGLTTDDWLRAALTIAVAALVGPTINSLVRRGALATARASALEPAGFQLDAVLHATRGHMIVMTDPDGTIVAFNSGAENLLGYSADEVVGKATPLLYHDPAQNRARAAAGGVAPGLEVYMGPARAGGVHTQDTTMVRKDGTKRIVSLSVSGVRDAAGTVIGYVGVGNDVTESRSAMQRLAAQQEIYRLLVENLPLTTVGLYDADLNCLTIGGYWLTKLGIASSELVGRHVATMFSDEDREWGVTLHRDALSGPVETERQLSTGQWYAFSAVPVAGPDGAKVVLSLARDVSGQHAADQERAAIVEALAVSESSFREAFERAPIGMAITSADGNERFLRVNGALAAILGRTAEELRGMAVADITHPSDLGFEPDLTTSDTEVSRTLRKRFVRPSGRAVWVEVTYALVRDSAGAPTHIIKQVQDIHTLKESERALLDALEQQRAVSAQLREIDEFRTELVGTVSHELRTPLTSIRGYLELLSEQPNSDLQRSMIDVATRNADRLAELVDNLLVLVRLDSAETVGELATTDVDVASAVAAAVDTVRPEIAERMQELSVTVPEAPTVIRVDSEQIDRVLVNLLSNASKYTPDRGQVDISVTTDAHTVHIAVTDTGIGIPDSEHALLFQRFFRASTARQHAITGNGLGLTIVKAIVERHAGTVEFTSAVGHGSRFVVTLPSVPAQQPPSAA